MNELQSLVVLIASLNLLGIGYYIYDNKMRRFAPGDFGIENFQRVAKFQSSEWRDKAYRVGITRSEWRRVLNKQLRAINQELAQRDSAL